MASPRMPTQAGLVTAVQARANSKSRSVQAQRQLLRPGRQFTDQANHAESQSYVWSSLDGFGSVILSIIALARLLSRHAKVEVKSHISG
jgi:hypothetical protein